MSEMIRIRHLSLVTIAVLLLCLAVLPFEVSAVSPAHGTLDFGLGANFFSGSDVSQLPTEKSWIDLITSFTSQDTQIQTVNLQVSDEQSLDFYTRHYDCFYLSSNPLPATDDIENSGLLPL